MALQTSTKRRSKKPLIIIAIVVLVLLGGYIAYAATSSSWPFTQKDASHTSDNTNLTPTNSKDNSQTTDTNSPADHTPVQNDTPSGDKTSSNKLTGVITSNSVSNGQLVLRTTINQLVEDGTCDLTLTNSSTGKVVKRSASIIANPSSSTCEGFNIPTSDLGSGSWDITINLTSGDRTGQITGSAKT